MLGRCLSLNRWLLSRLVLTKLDRVCPASRADPAEPWMHQPAPSFRDVLRLLGVFRLLELRLLPKKLCPSVRETERRAHRRLLLLPFQRELLSRRFLNAVGAVRMPPCKCNVWTAEGTWASLANRLRGLA